MHISQSIRLVTMALTIAIPLHASAQFKVLVGVDPADEVGKQNLAVATSPTPSLSAALGAQVLLKQTSDLTDVMRASRTQEADILIGPSHVTASAISHNYQLLARDNRESQFVLVARKDIERMDQLPGKRLYLTQQDSVRAYLAKGLLTESNYDLKIFKKTIFGKTSGAGLLALKSNLADVTVADRDEAQAWIKANPDLAHILKSTRQVPSGMAVMVRKSMPEGDRKNLLKWAASQEAVQSGFGKLQPTTSADDDQYRYIASLGILTPASLDGVKRVGADEVAKLIAAGATAVDTRTSKEYDQEHIAGAVHAPYVERSLKDRSFDPALDDFSAITSLSFDKPLIFFCNGPECWKSYKASKMAHEKGAKQVYWYRGGMPEWREKSMAIARNTRAPQSNTVASK